MPDALPCEAGAEAGCTGAALAPSAGFDSILTKFDISSFLLGLVNPGLKIETWGTQGSLFRSASHSRVFGDIVLLLPVADRRTDRIFSEHGAVNLDGRKREFL